VNLNVISDISAAEFAQDYIAKNQPVVVRGIPHKAEQWTPEALTESIGDFTAQIYGSLFDLEDIQSAAEYMEDYFGNNDGEYEEDIPYVRWYSQLKDVDFAWGDDAFSAVSGFWQKPNCLSGQDLLVPLTQQGNQANPVTGVKEAALYHPSRSAELQANSDSSSFGGFTDVRENDLSALSHEPDFHGEVHPGDMIYIPHGWLHDVIVKEDSVSITWNFVHQLGAQEFKQYLAGDAHKNDSEFEVLKYFYAQAGLPDVAAQDILEIANKA